MQIIERKQNNFEQITPQTLRESDRSIEVIAATETPARVFDPQRFAVVDETLLMSGAEISDSIPLTVEHERNASAVIGSFRDMRVDGGQLIGRVYFASDADSEKYYIRAKEGHLTKFSVVYPADSRESEYIDDGKTAMLQGRKFSGPMLITKRWKPLRRVSCWPMICLTIWTLR